MPYILENELALAIIEDKPTDLIKNYLTLGANPNEYVSVSASWYRWSLLACAVYLQRTESVRILLEHGATANQRIEQGSWSGWLLLNFAVYRDYPQIAGLLVRHGANPYCSFINGFWENWTPLAYAVEQNKVEMTQALLDGGTDANGNIPCGSWKNRSFLEHAVTQPTMPQLVSIAVFGWENKCYGNRDIARLLLERGANPNQWIQGSKHDLLTFALVHDSSIAEMLVAHGAIPDRVIPAGSWKGWSALAFAIFNNKVSLTRVLLEKGANLNQLIPGGIMRGVRLIDYARFRPEHSLMRMMVGTWSDKNFRAHAQLGAILTEHLGNRRKPVTLIKASTATKLSDQHQAAELGACKQVITNNAKMFQQLHSENSELKRISQASRERIASLEAQLLPQTHPERSKHLLIPAQLETPAEYGSSPDGELDSGDLMVMSVSAPKAGGLFTRNPVRLRSSAVASKPYLPLTS